MISMYFNKKLSWEQQTPVVVTMSRPVRAAALRARELWQSGEGKRALERDEIPGMSSGEEEEMDEHETNDSMSADDEDVVHQPMDHGAARPVEPRMKTYGDDDSSPFVPPFTPNRAPGPHLADRVTRCGMQGLTRAVDFFQLFFTPELVLMLCDNTNLYGWLTIFDKPSYATPQGTWEEVTYQEMLSFLGLCIMMGFIRLHDNSRYWSQATLYSCGWACRFMSRQRFKAISSMLHASNPSTEDPTDRLTKVRPLLEYIRRLCLSLYQPHEHLSVDERMVRSKARSGLRQFIPNKPVRFGFKLWCLCQSGTGYTANFRVYTGRRQQTSPNGLGHDVVTDLLAGHLGQGYKVYFDNFFTSLPLIKYLMSKRTSACGTSVVTRRGFPVALRDKEWVKTAQRGDTRFIRTDQILCQQWLDNRPVCVCSSIHKGGEFVMVKRHQKLPDGGHRQILIKRPTAIHDYNTHMGGVDISDQMLQPYSILQKSKKWWKTLFFHLVDMAILNSFLLFREWQQLYPHVYELQRPDGYSHQNFREELSQQLAGISDMEPHPFAVPRPRSKSHFGFDGVHFPRHSDTRRNCRVCYILHGKENKTKWYCSEDQCKAPICLSGERNCFILWHTDTFQELKQRMGK